MPPISARVQIEKHFDGPCPNGELVGLYYENPRDNPLDPTDDILHLIVRCPNDIATDGGGGILPFGSGGKPGGTTRGSRDGGGLNGIGGGRGSLYFPQASSSEGVVPLTPEEKRVYDSINCADCPVKFSTEFTDQKRVQRSHAGCLESECRQLAKEIASLLNIQNLSYYPGLKACLERTFPALKWCCHPNFDLDGGPYSDTYNYNISNEVDDPGGDARLTRTIADARETGVVRLGTWFFDLSNSTSYQRQFFLLRLLASLCDLGNGGKERDANWLEVSVLLSTFPDEAICAFLNRMKRMNPESWNLIQANCDRDPDWEGNTVQGKFFAINLCTGDLFHAPLPPPSSGRKPTPVTDHLGYEQGLQGYLGCVK